MESLEDIVTFFMAIRRDSRHREGKQERIVGYDHTGYAKWKCDCGQETDWEEIKLGNM
jgi:hypothetical protein